MRRGLAIVAALAAATAACGSPAAPTVTTGLTGTVTRGPITPVCQVNVLCDAPFAAGFSVTTSTAVLVAHFRSDTAGHFTVYLAPGSYRIVPDPDAPILAPASQAKTVAVGPSGLSEIQLQFDTGIR